MAASEIIEVESHVTAIYLARDRFGEKPLYYGWIPQNKSFVFSSDLIFDKLFNHIKFDINEDRIVIDNIDRKSNELKLTLQSRKLDKNSITAAKNLAVMYRNGHGVTKNEEMCFSLNLKAAKSGDVDAQLQVMGSYVHGNGVAISKKDAAYWCNLAREKGSPAAEAYWESFELSKYE